MQKFIVIKKANDVIQEKTAQNQQAKVQMSGYLKKKRNKVGGWRKMWFVLQNQLLLSYNSKEEYDKKLVCFKDVINLVPGTVVRPLGGFRFTIETTTDTIFIFRCDDNKSCTNWITALIESLSMQGQCAKENGLRIKTKLNTSLESIRQMRPKRVVRMSYSWDSICQSHKNSATNKLPNIPIAQNTARILKRTGVDLNKATQQHQQHQQNYDVEKARNFRLHDKHLQPQQQSIEVSRINQMFIMKNLKQHLKHQNCSKNENENENNIFTSSSSTTAATTNSSSTSTLSSSNNSMKCNASAANVNTTRINKNDDGDERKCLNHFIPATVATKTSTTSQAKIQKQSRLVNTSELVKNSTATEIGDKKRKCKDNESLKDLNRNEMTEMCESSLEDQIQRLTLKDSSGFMMDSTILHQNQHNNITQKKSNGEAYAHHHHHHQYNGINRGVTQDIYNNDDGIDENNVNDADDSPMNTVVNDTVPDYSLYDPLNLKQHHNEFNNIGNGNNEMNKLFPSRLSASSENVNPIMMMMLNENIDERVEPIYAVVDLKNKYARRAKLRELEMEGLHQCSKEILSSTTSGIASSVIEGDEQQEKRERPKSIHVVSSDYEEVLNFSNDCLDKDDDENENIYEPINIPEGSLHNNHRHHHHHHHHPPHSRNVMWRYFPRINIEALIEMARHRKKDTKLEPQSSFSDIRRKFGNHRKSIKIRMKRFYSKESPINTTNDDASITFKERNAFSDDELDSQGATGSNSGTSDNSIKSSCGNIEKPSSSSSSSYVFNEIDKYRRGEKQIFGSLSRLKKTSRTSICLDGHCNNDDNENHHLNGGGKKLLVTPKCACFQQEIKRDVSKRTETKKAVCHSKFYD